MKRDPRRTASESPILAEEQKLDRVHALLFGWNTPRTQPQPQPAPLPPSAPEASIPSPRQSSPISQQNSLPPAPHSPEFTPIPPENSPKLT